MAAPTSTPLAVDGVALDTFAHWVGLNSARYPIPGTKGANVPVPARHGALWVAGKTFTEPELTLDIVVRGVQDDGTVPADQLAQASANIDKLLRLLTKRHALLHLEQAMPDGSVRECFAECVTAFDLTRVSRALPYARFAVELRVPGAFWRDQAESTFTSAAGLLDEQVLAMPPFAGGTAPMDDLVYVVHGPADNPELVVHASGAYTRLAQNLPDGDDWRIDSATWESVVGTDIGFGGTGTSAIGDTIHGGSARLMDLPPLSAGDPAIQFNGQNLGANTQVEVRGRRKFLVA